MKKLSFRSAALLTLTAVIWGFAFSAQVVAAENGMGSFTFNGIRFLVGSLSLLPLILIFERKPLDREFVKHTLLPGFLVGLVLFIAATLQQYGITLTKSAGKTSFITGLYIVLVPVLAWIIFRKKTTVNTWLGVLLAVAGLYFLSIQPGERIALGDVLSFIGAFFWAGHILTVDRFVGKSRPITFASVQFFTVGVLATVTAFGIETVTWTGITASFLPLLYAGVMSSGVAYTCQILGQRDADPTVASILLSMESVFGALSGFLINHEHLSLRSVGGCALMFAGIVISQLTFKKAEHN